MLNALLRLLNNSDFEYEDLEKCLYCATTRLDKILSAPLTAFEKTDEGYELRYNVADDATAKNVNVEYDENTREIEIVYDYKNGNYKSYAKLEQALPEDADDKTIEATVEDGEIVIKVAFLQTPEPETDEPEDTKTVKVHRLANGKQ